MCGSPCKVSKPESSHFDTDRRIEFEKIEVNVNALSDAGDGTFLVAANISEYHSLSP